MKNSIILVITLVSFVTIFSSCESKSKEKQRNQPFEIPASGDNQHGIGIIVDSLPNTFTPDSVRVTEPEEGDFLFGEGEIPATMYRAYVYFIDSSGDKFGIYLNQSVYKDAKYYDDSHALTTDSKEVKAKEMFLQGKAKECFEQITKSELKDLIVTIENGEIVQVEQKVYSAVRKIGNAIVEQKATKVLWPYK